MRASVPAASLFRAHKHEPRVLGALRNTQSIHRRGVRPAFDAQGAGMKFPRRDLGEVQRSSLVNCSPPLAYPTMVAWTGPDSFSWHTRPWQVSWGTVNVGFCCTLAEPYPSIPAHAKLLEVEQQVHFFSTTKVRARRCCARYAGCAAAAHQPSCVTATLRCDASACTEHLL